MVFKRLNRKCQVIGVISGITICVAAFLIIVIFQRSKMSDAHHDLAVRENSVKDGAKLQQQGTVKNVGKLLIKKNFEELEKIATYFRKQRVRSRGGNWQLNYYYENLSERWGGFEPSKENWLYEIFDEWIKKMPESATPLIAKARAYIDFAWNARGRGYASTVTEDGWKACKEKLDKAWALLDDAERLNPLDPEIYALQIEICRMVCRDREEIEAIFEKGINIEQLYCPLYYEMATTLMPRWHGKKGELEAFMDRAVELTRELEGESFYPRICNMVFRYFRFDDFQEKFNIPYERLKAGYWDLLEEYPETRYYLNSFCYIACLNKDKETAKQLLERIGNDYDSSAWRGSDSFERRKKWALSE